jgi:hypothetical protein
MRCDEKATYKNLFFKIKECISDEEEYQKIMLAQIENFIVYNPSFNQDDRELLEMFFLESPKSIEEPIIESYVKNLVYSAMNDSNFDDKKEWVEFLFNLGLQREPEYLVELIEKQNVKKLSEEDLKNQINWLGFLIKQIGIDPNLELNDEMYLSSISLENDDKHLLRTLALIDFGMDPMPPEAETEIVKHVLNSRLSPQEKRDLLSDPRLRATRVYDFLSKRKKKLFNQIMEG